MFTKFKNLIKKINLFFVDVILFLFYFLIFGLISLIYKLFKKENKKKILIGKKHIKLNLI